MKPAVFLLLCAVSCVCQTSPKQPTASRKPLLDQALAWLPADTETIIGVNGPYPLPDLGAESQQNDTEEVELRSTELELRVKTFALGLLLLKNGGLQDFLKGKSVTLALEGSRRFRAPTQLGEMLYEGCLIARFSGTLDHDSYMKSAASSAKRVESIEGVPIAVFEESLENDVWTTLVAFPRNNVVLVSTNEDYLRTVLSRMGGSVGLRALPASLPEWKFVNTHAPAWGLRHYRKEDAAQDPTSPFQGEAAANISDDKATGVTFWFEAVSRRMVTVNYLSSNVKARQILSDHLMLADSESASPREFQIRLRQRAPGVVEGTASLSKTEAFYHLWFGLTAMLGHAVYM